MIFPYEYARPTSEDRIAARACRVVVDLNHRIGVGSNAENIQLNDYYEQPSCDEFILYHIKLAWIFSG